MLSLIGSDQPPTKAENCPSFPRVVLFLDLLQVYLHERGVGLASDVEMVCPPMWRWWRTYPHACQRAPPTRNRSRLRRHVPDFPQLHSVELVVPCQSRTPICSRWAPWCRRGFSCVSAASDPRPRCDLARYSARRLTGRSLRARAPDQENRRSAGHASSYAHRRDETGHGNRSPSEAPVGFPPANGMPCGSCCTPGRRTQGGWIGQIGQWYVSAGNSETSPL